MGGGVGWGVYGEGGGAGRRRTKRPTGRNDTENWRGGDDDGGAIGATMRSWRRTGRPRRGPDLDASAGGVRGVVGRPDGGGVRGGPRAARVGRRRRWGRGVSRDGRGAHNCAYDDRGGHGGGDGDRGGDAAAAAQLGPLKRRDRRRLRERVGARRWSGRPPRERVRRRGRGGREVGGRWHGGAMGRSWTAATAIAATPPGAGIGGGAASAGTGAGRTAAERGRRLGTDGNAASAASAAEAVGDTEGGTITGELKYQGVRTGGSGAEAPVALTRSVAAPAGARTRGRKRTHRRLSRWRWRPPLRGDRRDRRNDCRGDR